MPALRSPLGPLQPLPFARTVVAFGLPSALRQFRQVAIPLDVVPPYWRALERIRARFRPRSDAAVRVRRSFSMPRFSLRFTDRLVIAAIILLAIVVGGVLAIRDVHRSVACLRHAPMEEVNCK